MKILLMGYGLGLFSYWAGGLFLKFLKTVLDVRRGKELVKAEEVMEKMVEKIISKREE